MTLEEALAKVAQLESEAQELKNQIKNQNSYITKLEAKAASTQQQTAGPKDLDPITKRYLEKNMMKDTINEAKEHIVSQVGIDIYNAVEPDLKVWLDANMKIESCTVEFVEDSFNLIYGRCFRNKEHNLHKVLGKGTTTPVTTPITQQVTNPNVIINTPPVITSKDGTPSAMPNITQAKTKKDIFSDFSKKVIGTGNPFQ